MAAGGGTERRLTNNDAHDDWATFSPDGSEIAFESNREGRSEIFTMSATGAAQTRLTVTIREISTGVFTARASKRPIFSPDGSRILFQAPLDDDVGQLYTSDATVEGPQVPTRLTFNNLVEVDFLWAPDGTEVLYVAFAEGEDGRLFTLGLESARAVQILTQVASRPSWR